MNTPTLESITKAYNEITELMKDVSTVEKCREVAKRRGLTIEINGFFIEEYANQFVDEKAADAAIDWIRVEDYEMLNYVYFHKNGAIFFDVWSDDMDDDFLVDVTIDTLEAAYADGLKWLEEKMNERFYQKFDSVGSENTDY